VAYSPNGQWLASGSWDKTVRVWDARTGELFAILPHPAVVWALAFGPDSLWLATSCHGDDQLRIWDVATARIRKEVPTAGKAVHFLAVDPKRTSIAVTVFQGQKPSRLSIFDEATAAEVFSSEGIALAYSPDGKWLAGCSADKKVLLLWDAETHQLSARFVGHEGTINSAAFSMDGRWLASCGTDRVVRVWEIATGNCRELRGHTDEVFAVAFHPGGTRLASAGRDRAIWLWDLATGEEVARLQGHAAYVWSLAFSPDGATMASGSGDGTVRLWDTAPLAERHQARREAEELRPKAERWVEQFFQEKKGPADVVAALGADPALTEPFRRAAMWAIRRHVGSPP
jgi:eukaryotic-like serine/threonine-protein kinase